MSNKYQILLSNLELFSSLKRELNFILEDYEKDIRGKINEIDSQTHEKSIETIKVLFEIQNQISVVKYRFNYEISDFLNDFIYDFDRQDEESIDYLINKFKR